MTSPAKVLPAISRWLFAACVMAIGCGGPSRAPSPGGSFGAAPGARPAAQAPVDVPGPLRLRLATWNLEHLHDGKKRGFPEYTRGGPTLPPRTDEDYEAIARIVRNRLALGALVLQEVHAADPEDGDDPAALRSPELDRLVASLGEPFQYVVGASGRAQRIGLVFDSHAARLNAVCEADVPAERVQGKAVFDRRPFVAHLTLLAPDGPMNDLTVVGLHLASGQRLADNHDRAIALLVEALDELRGAPCLPEEERDIAIVGDFNANRFDTVDERLWQQLESSGWDVLADDDASYRATRLSGHPLALSASAIDYIVVSGPPLGLSGREVTATQATIHTELLDGDPDAFRRSASDHLPVSIEIFVGPDDD